MQWLKELTGIGEGKRCLIIGGGRSTGRFDFSKVPEDVVIIGCNESGLEADTRLDYMVYYDNDFNRIFHKTKPCKVICSNHALNPKCDYQYRLKELRLCEDSDNIGKKALVIAKDVFNFDEIYLIGFDFKTEKVDGKEVSHFYGDPVGKNKKYVEDMKVRDHIHRLSEMIPQFDNVQYYKNVWNLNPDSALKTFPFKEEINGSNTRKKYSEIST